MYGLGEKKIDTILEYQKLLPILHQNNGNLVNGRELHEQLKVGKDYSTWIKEQFEDLEAEEGNDYSSLKGSKKSGRGGHNKIEYLITIELAKQIAMIAGVKGGRTNEELKHRSSLTRKYFIYIEEAFD